MLIFQTWSSVPRFAKVRFSCRYIRDLSLIALVLLWLRAYPEANKSVHTVNLILGCLLEYPEVDHDVLERLLDLKIASLALSRMAHYPKEEEIDLLSTVVYLSYLHGDRKSLRGLLSHALLRTHTLKCNFFYTNSILNIIKRIAAGFNNPLSPSNMELFRSAIIPLHEMQGKTSHSVACLGEYHKELVECMATFVKGDSQVFEIALQGILKYWPDPREGNSPREVLFLHELETLLDIRPCDIPPKLQGSIIGHLSRCIISENSLISERTLILWKNERVATLLDQWMSDEKPFQLIVGFLLGDSLSHWNKTVCRMSALVIRRYIDHEFLTVDLLLRNGIHSKEELVHILKKYQMEAPPKPTIKITTAVPSKDPSIHFMNMIVAEELGHGSFAQVFRALRVVPGKPQSQWTEYAIKRIDATKHRSIALREAEMMDRVSHPNCTRLSTMYESAGVINLVMEYAALGDLHDMLRSVGSLNEESTVFITVEIAAGLNALHSKELVFGDLKPENVLIHANGHVKLGDFGATRSISSIGDDPVEGTLCYLAPELFHRRNVNEEEYPISHPAAIDWWAFGCLVYHLLSGRPPIWVEQERELVKTLVSFNFDKFPQNFPPAAKDLVSKLLITDPSYRLASIFDLESHEFYAKLGFSFDEAHNHAAPQVVQGEVKPQPGPWTQRTYSMIHSPLPQSYAITKYPNHSSLLMTETEKESDYSWRFKGIEPFQFIFQNPKSASTPTHNKHAVPKMRFNPTTSMPCPPKPRNMFKNLDLSAGSF